MRHARFPAALRAVGLCLLVHCASGCQPSGPLQSAGMTLSVTDPWRPVEPTRWQVPGRALAAWSGPEGSSLVVYQGLPVPGGGKPATIAEGLANRLTNLPELRILERRELPVGGQSAVRLDLIAPGFGDSLAPSGVGTPMPVEGKLLIPTRQTTVILARHAGPLYLTWHGPESAWPRIAPEIESTLGRLALAADSPASSSSY